MAAGGGTLSEPGSIERAGGLRLAGGLFTVLPFKPVNGLDRDATTRAMAWFPWLGLLLGTMTAAVLAALGRLGAGAMLLGVLGVALVEMMTGFMHLDGLADTSDGLGSRKPPQEALEIMKRNDLGPMGVASVVLFLLIQVAALSGAGNYRTIAVLAALAPMVGRLACVLSCGSWIPTARPGGFGALFAGVTTPIGGTLQGVAVTAVCAGVGWGLGGLPVAALLVAAALAAMVAAHFWSHHLIGRFGGLTGDMFGSLIELSTAVFLIVASLRGLATPA